MLIDEKNLRKIQGNGFALKNKFNDKHIEIKIETPDLANVSYLFSFLLSFIIFKPAQNLTIIVRKSEQHIPELDISFNEVIEQILSSISLLASLYNTSISFPSLTNSDYFQVEFTNFN